jgi:hypothetical protein
VALGGLTTGEAAHIGAGAIVAAPSTVHSNTRAAATRAQELPGLWALEVTRGSPTSSARGAFAARKTQEPRSCAEPA